MADPGLPPADNRTIRDLEARNQGTPSLPTQAPRQEGLLKLAELGGAATAAGANWSQEDKDALFALLQTYRDELLALGMDAAELEAQLQQLKVRTTEVEGRLEKLKPKDGLKIHAHIYAAVDDLHLIGNAPILGVADRTSLAGKPAYLGIRNQYGVTLGTFDLSGTRGRLSADVLFSIMMPVGTNSTGSIAPRRVLVEVRLPIAIQFGDFDASLSPFTLWRNDSEDPFEPEPFASREKRLREDLLLKPNAWRLTGARLSTEPHLFDKIDLGLENITAFLAFNSNGSFQPTTDYRVPDPLIPTYMRARYNTYLDAWRLKVPVGEAKQIAYQGILIWDDNTSIASQVVWRFRSMLSSVHTASLDLGFGPVRLQAEGGLSSFSAPSLITVTAADPLTGTAVRASLAWNAEHGSVELFGRMVSAGFHSAGAQGRTEDAAWQRLGPMLTENSQLGADGKTGLMPGINMSHASRLNDLLLPPGMAIGSTITASSIVTNRGPWVHLLSYFPHEEIDPYGEATPNRSVYGADAKWSFGNGLFKPLVSYEMGANLEPVYDALSNSYAAFTMTRLRGGLELDLAPPLNWPLAFGFGYAATTSSNGTKNALGKDWSLSSTLMDMGLIIGKGHPYGLAAGYRILSFDGYHPATIGFQSLPSPLSKQSWDMLGIGGWWRPMEGTSVDLVYSSGHFDVPDDTLQGWQSEQVVLRLTTEF
jgi:hypothetical protein